MRNPVNAVSDTLAALGMAATVRDDVTPDPNNPRRWIIRFESDPNALIRSFMEVEVIEEDDGDAAVCVLRRFNVGRRVMFRIMNRLVEELDDEARLVAPLEQRRGVAAPLDPQH
jgi:hypothetical protein